MTPVTKSVVCFLSRCVYELKLIIPDGPILHMQWMKNLHNRFIVCVCVCLIRGIPWFDWCLFKVSNIMIRTKKNSWRLRNIIVSYDKTRHLNLIACKNPTRFPWISTYHVAGVSRRKIQKLHKIVQKYQHFGISWTYLASPCEMHSNNVQTCLVLVHYFSEMWENKNIFTK